MAPLRGLPPGDDGTKAYGDGGTCRVVAPEATLARVLPLSPRFGLTRVAVLTGLDTLGIPVAAAVRPNSRSLAVFQGKGVTDGAAKASAVMEAVEAWHAETLDLPLRWACARELGAAAVDPALLPRAAVGLPAADAPNGALADLPMLWVEGREITTGEARLVPLDLVHADYTVHGPPSPGLFQATTNGLASGNHILEAILHALCEAVERDAFAVWRAKPRAARDATAIDPASVTDPVAAGLIGRLEAAGVTVRLWDATSDVGLPAALCLIAPGAGSGSVAGPQAETGSGCHPDPAVALVRAVTEAAQARLTRISGARDDDTLPDGYAAGRRALRALAAADWAAATVGSRDAGAVRGCAGPTLRADLEAAAARLTAAGLDEAVWVDLTKSELGIPVARVVIPGLEGLVGPEGGGYVPGSRASRAAVTTAGSAA